MKTLFKCTFGSHLYGTSTPTSDTDYKGIVIPDLQFLIHEKPFVFNKTTGNNDSRNGADDVDLEMYSLRKFMNLCYAGDTSAIDMLHATEESTIVTSDVWEYLQANRTKFYTKNMSSYVGYARRQSSKYCLKGSRLDVLEQVRQVLLGVKDQSKRLSEVQPELLSLSVDNDYLSTYTGFYKGDKWVDKSGIRVCESKFDWTAPVNQVVESLTKRLNNYGERARLAKENKGVDYKALHHALRAGYQARDIFLYGDFQYPLEETPYLMEVKRGETDFNEVKDVLEDLIDEVKRLSDESDLPDLVDKEPWEEFLESVYMDEYKRLIYLGK